MSTRPPSDDERDSDPYTMTEAVLVKRSKHEDKGRYITQLYLGIVTSGCSLCFGAMLGWSSPALRRRKKFERAALRHVEDVSWVTSLVPAGICFGVIVWAGYFNIKWGPRKSLIVQAPFNIATWCVLGFRTTQSMYMAARFCCGFFSVSYIICGETLLIDSIHRGYLRRMMIMFRASQGLGILLMYITGIFVRNANFSLIVPVYIAIHTVLLCICPESPVFLFDKNEKQAMKSLRWYRGRINLSIEVRNMRKDCEYLKVDPEAHNYMLSAKVVIKGLLRVIVLTFFQVFSGYYAFIFYNSHIWLHVMGPDEVAVNKYADPIIYGLCLFVFSFIFMKVHYYSPFGVRKPLLVSFLLVSIDLCLISTFCFLHEYRHDSKHFIKTYLKSFPLAAVCFNIFAYEMGLSSIPDFLLHDYMPYQVYPRARTIAMFFRWFFVFCLVKTFHQISVLISYSWSFLLCTVGAIIGMIYAYFFVVETKGKTLVQIQIDLGGNPVGNRGAYKKQRDNVIAM